MLLKSKPYLFISYFGTKCCHYYTNLTLARTKERYLNVTSVVLYCVLFGSET